MSFGVVGPLRQGQIGRFRRDGYLLGPEVLTSDEVDQLRAELQRVLDEPTDGPRPVMMQNLGADPNAPVWQVVNIWEASEAFRMLVYNPSIVAAIGQLMDTSSVRLWHDQIQYKPAERGGTNKWHQDSPLWPVLTPMTQVTAWVALDDVDEENGCMSMIAGSHLWGDQSAYLDAQTSFELPGSFDGAPVQRQLCPVRKGQVHFHHGLTWHGSHGNRSGRMRRAIALHYMDSNTRFMSTGSHPMDRFIESGDGLPIAGNHFPLVLAGGSPVPMPPRPVEVGRG